MRVKSFLGLAIVSFFAYAFGCANKNVSSQNSGNTDSTKLPPVETNGANTNYPPAFAGQTRINGAKTTTPYRVDKIAENLGRPWAVVPMPDGRLLITEKSGYMQIHNANGAIVKKITGFPKVEDGGQG